MAGTVLLAPMARSIAATVGASTTLTLKIWNASLPAASVAFR